MKMMQNITNTVVITLKTKAFGRIIYAPPKAKVTSPAKYVTRNKKRPPSVTSREDKKEYA
jgi:hypothetical protein